MSCDMCWEFFAKRRQIAELKKENNEMKEVVREALSQVESTHKLIKDYTERIDSMLDTVHSGSFGGQDEGDKI